jgi:hypothetical protein
MTCLDSVEEPIFEKQFPVALDAFRQFSAKRRYLAQQADTMNAPGIAASAKYQASDADAIAVLKAHEPKAAEPNSILNKEIAALKAPAACKQETMVEQTNCIANIVRPVWERNAPDTIHYYDEWRKKRLEFARIYDATGAKESKKRAVEFLLPGIRQALAEFRENAQRDIQAANARDAAAREQALQTFGNIVAGVAAVTLAAAEIKAAQQPPAAQQTVYVQQPVYTPPTHCVSRNLAGAVYTDCQ